MELENKKQTWNQIKKELEKNEVALISLKPGSDLNWGDQRNTVNIKYGEMLGKRDGKLEIKTDEDYQELIEYIGEHLEDYETDLFYTPEESNYKTEVFSKN